MINALGSIIHKWPSSRSQKSYVAQAIKTLTIEKALVVSLFLIGNASLLVTYHYFPWIVFYSDVLAFFCLAITCLWYTLNDGQTALRLTPTFFVLLAMSAIPVTQYFFGLVFFYGDALVASFFIFTAAIAYSIGFSLTEKNKTSVLTFFAWFFLVTSLASSLVGIIQWLNLSSHFSPLTSILLYSENPRAAGNLNQANNYATLLVMGTFSVFYLHTKRSLSGLTVLLSLAVITLACAMAQSKTSWISIGFVCACGVFFRYKYKLSVKSTWLIGLVFFFTVCVVCVPWLASVLYDSSASIVDRVSGESPRKAMWLGLLEAVKQSPLEGYGWLQVPNAQLSIAADTAPMQFTQYSHNLLLDLCLWNGPLLGIGIIVFFAYRLFVILVSCRNDEAWFCLAILSPLLIHAMLEYPLYYAYFLLPFALVLGLSSQAIEKKGLVSISKGALCWVCVFLIVILYRSVHEYRYQEANDRTIRGIAGQERPDAIVSPPRFQMFNQLSGFVEFAKTPVKTNLSQQELDDMGRIAHRFAYVEIMFRYALVLGVNNRGAEAAIELKKLKNLYGDNMHLEACTFLKTASAKYPVLKTIAFDCPA